MGKSALSGLITVIIGAHRGLNPHVQGTNSPSEGRISVKTDAERPNDVYTGTEY